MNILLKLMSVVALVIAPSIALNADNLTDYNNEITIELTENVTSKQEVKKIVKVQIDENGEKTATITTTTTVDGEEKVVTETLKGEEVEELIKDNE